MTAHLKQDEPDTANFLDTMRDDQAWGCNRDRPLAARSRVLNPLNSEAMNCSVS